MISFVKRGIPKTMKPTPTGEHTDEPDSQSEKTHMQSDKKPKKRIFRKPTRKEAITEAIKLTCLLLVLSPMVAWPLYSKMLFFPDKTTHVPPAVFDKIAEHYKAKWEEVYLPTANGKRIHAYLFNQPGTQYTALISHGNAGNSDYRSLLIANLLQCGLSVMIFDYQGYGKSEGEPTCEGITDDGIAAYDYLVREKHVAPEAVVLYGESLGCSVAMNTMKHRKVAGVIAQSGFSSLVTAARDRLPWLWLFPASTFPVQFDNVAALRGEHPPVLLIHGTKDFMLPVRYAEEMYAGASEPKTLLKLPDAGHNDIAVVDLPQYIAGVMGFLKTLSPPVHTASNAQK